MRTSKILACLNYKKVKWDAAGELSNNTSSQVNGFNESSSLNNHYLSPHQRGSQTCQLDNTHQINWHSYHSQHADVNERCTGHSYTTVIHNRHCIAFNVKYVNLFFFLLPNSESYLISGDKDVALSQTQVCPCQFYDCCISVTTVKHDRETLLNLCRLKVI